MKITDRKYLDANTRSIGAELPALISAFDFTDQNGTFDHLTRASAVYSSNIEGNSVDLNAYMNYRLNRDRFKAGKEIEEINDLVEAYAFAQANQPNERNLLHAHKLLSRTFLIKSKRGQYRIEPVGVFGRAGLVYMAIEPELVEGEMARFFTELRQLLEATLNETEVFYFASMIHLRLAHIHPFRDGNGRVARLLEKWFITEKLGRDFWRIPAEEYYKNHQVDYYERINLGVNFHELDYGKCLAFFEMLPNCLR